MIVTDLRPGKTGKILVENLDTGETEWVNLVRADHCRTCSRPLPHTDAEIAACRTPNTAGRAHRCKVTVTWVDTGVTCRCLRPTGHDGPHRDGVEWFDDHGLRVPHVPAVETPTRGSRAGHRTALQASR